MVERGIIVGKNHLTSLFLKTFRKTNTLSIRKSDPAYEFLEREYKNEFAKDGNDNLLVRTEILEIRRKKEELMELKRTIRRVSVGTSAYQFFINEYRQNTPMRDTYGNIILSDDLEIPTRRI